MNEPTPTTRSGDAEIIRQQITLLIKQSGLSREQIADEMSARMGGAVTARMIYAFTAESKEEHRWPAQYDIAFCEMLGDYSLLADRVARAGFRMIGPEEERLIAIGQAFMDRARSEKILAEATGL